MAPRTESTTSRGNNVDFPHPNDDHDDKDSCAVIIDSSNIHLNKKALFVLIASISVVIVAIYLKNYTNSMSYTAVVSEVEEEDGSMDLEEVKPKKFRRVKQLVGKVFSFRNKKEKKRSKKTSDLDEDGSLVLKTKSGTKRNYVSRVEKLSKQEMDVLLRTKANVKDIEEMAQLVPWGGPSSGNKKVVSWWSDELFAAYLIIMKFPPDLRTDYPFVPCGDETCSTDFGIRHTLEYRLKYKPWLVTPSLIEESRSGAIYVHGVSHSGASIIWYKPGLHKIKSNLSYNRLILYTLEKAITDSLKATDGKVGKYFAFLDCDKFKLSSLPGLNEAKKTIKMLQDHLPDRLETLYLINLSTPAQIFLKMITSILSKEVRQKIIPIPSKPEECRALMFSIMDEEAIPKDYMSSMNKDSVEASEKTKFDAEKYFGSPTGSNEEGEEYIQTMPYHA